jgi:two-component system, chemotaxis family, sensor kinase CheA
VNPFSDDRGAELRELFFETAQELLQALNDEALLLEKTPSDTEIVRNIRRTVHTLKGDAAACGFRELSELAHELEDALALESLSSLTSLPEIAFTAADAFGAMLAAYRGQSSPPSPEPLRKMIRALAQQAPGAPAEKAPASPSAVQPDWAESDRAAIQHALAQGKRVYRITAQLDPLCTMPIAARQLVLNAVASIGEVLGAPPEPTLPQAIVRIQFVLASNHSAEQIAAKCRIPTIIAHVNVQEIQDSARQPETAPAVAAAPLGTLPAQTEEAADAVAPIGEEREHEGKANLGSGSSENILRVDAERIDTVLNLVGELIIGKSMLQQVLNELVRHYPKDAIRGRLSDVVAFQARVLNDLQRSVMKVRMVPVEQLFRRFPRMIRDVSKRCGRDVQLIISGQDTDLDKSLLDAIAEPLTHLVRNAISHGIEAPEERARLGKPAQGSLRLSAYHHGNQVVVELSDDGRGIDVQRVKAKAIEQKLISREQAAALSESEAVELLFRSGFSTAQEITQISGRGVGLDVVQTVLQRLKGTVEVVNRPGEGVTFRLRLPLTLAIIKALLFRVERRLYAIPLNAVAEIARATEADLHQVDEYEVLQLRNQVLQLVRLGQRDSTIDDPKKAKFFILVIALGERKLGLIVDALEGEEELVIKAVDDQTVATDLISGASILGDGRVVLILNLSAVVERAAKSCTGAASSGLLLLHKDQRQAIGKAAGVQS